LAVKNFEILKLNSNHPSSDSKKSETIIPCVSA
jgi:hypothetical protein